MTLTPLFTLAAFALSSAATSFAADLSPDLPKIPDKSFVLSDYGAAPEGKVPTHLFDQAIAAVAAAGGGTLVVPAGTWFTEPFDLCSNLNLHLEKGAKILFNPDHETYRNASSKTGYRPLLFASHCHDIEISGPGTIDGYGSSWWPSAIAFKEEANAAHRSSNTSPRPRLVQLEDCVRVLVQGVTLQNSPVFNLVPVRCTDVTISGITIKNPYLQSPNTDGIDPSVSNRVLITHCTIDTDDDNIAIKAGAEGAGVMTDVLITDCTFLHGHGCSVGSETYSGLSHVIVQRCTFDGTETAIRLKSDRRRGGLVENIIYRDITMTHVGAAISISSYYAGTTSDTATDGKPFAVTKTTPHWKDILIQNVTSVDGRKSAGAIIGLPEMPAESITLDNVRLAAPTGFKIKDATGITLKAVTIEASKGEALMTDATVKGLVRID